MAGPGRIQVDRGGATARDAPTNAALPTGLLAGLIFLLALTVRVVYLLEVRSVPFFQHLIVDAAAYHEWARQIAAGDWLGHEAFYQAPLYPYFLAAAMRIVGDDLFVLRLVQAVVGAAACVLLVYAGQNLAGRRVGLIAGVLLALYPPAIFFDGLIQKTVLDNIGVAALLLLISRAQRAPTTRGFAWLGLCLGLLILTRENALLFIPVIGVWIVWRFAEQVWRRRSTWLACFAAGLALALIPVGLRNQHVGGEFILTTYQGGPNFFIGNNPAANGSYISLRPGRGNTPFERIDATRLAEQAAGHPLRPGDVSRYWYGRGLEYIRSEPIRWLQLVGLKIYHALNTYEIPDAEDQVFFAQHSVILRGFGYFSHFGVILPLAVAGLMLAGPLRRDLWLPVALAMTLLASLALFFVLARYRYPLAPILIVLSAVAVDETVRLVRVRRWRRLAPAAGVAALMALAANAPTPFPGRAQLATSNSNAGLTLAGAGDLDGGLAYLREALRIDPKLVEAHYGLGKVLLMKGRQPEALGELQIALADGPNVPYVLTAVGAAHLMGGDAWQAASFLERAVVLDPHDAEAWVNLGEAYRRQQRWPDALAVLRRGCDANPNEPELTLRLAWTLATAPDPAVRDGAGAVRLAEETKKRMRVPGANALDVLAAAYAAAGRFDEAVRTARQAAELARRGRDYTRLNEIEQRLQLYQAGQAYRQ